MVARFDVLREELLRRGWIENVKSGSPIFSFKWTWDTDRIADVSLHSTKIVNHFMNNEEIGTKLGLVKNLNALQGQFQFFTS